MVIHLYFFTAQKVLNFKIYKANNHYLEGRVQTFCNQLQHDTRQSKLCYVKKANTTHRLLSITVRGIHISAVEFA